MTYYLYNGQSSVRSIGVFFNKTRMSKIEEYGFNCLMGMKDDVEMLNIEVRSRRFKDECYSSHFRYEDLPKSIQLIFKNIAQLFIFLQRKEMVYFDEQQQALKLCLPIAGQIKEFPITLHSYCKPTVIKEKIAAYQKEKEKIHAQFRLISIGKQQKLQAARKELEQIQSQNKFQEQAFNQVSQANMEMQAQMIKLKKQSDDLMSNIRELVPKQSQIRLLDVNDFKHHEERKRFWIEEIGKLKKDKFQMLRLHINKTTNFEEQKILALNHMKLTKMLFVEIFINVEVLDLSNNMIVSIQGLKPLRQLLKLKLSSNKITNIPLLPRFQKLVELILSSNLIKKLENVFHIPNLQILNLSLNKIQAVPDEISKLNRLVELRLYQNHISMISQKILMLKNIKIFSIMRNKCYNEGSRGREIINKMMKNGIKTAIEEIEEICILE